MRIKIIFETQTGTTKYVAEVVQRELQAAGHEVVLHSLLGQGLTPNLDDVDVLLFGAPTYDDGYLEKNMREWIKTQHPDFSQRKVAIFGLGNRTYPQFCIAADVLEAWVKENHGQPIVETLRVDHFPDDLKPIEEWSAKFIAALR